MTTRKPRVPVSRLALDNAAQLGVTEQRVVDTGTQETESTAKVKIPVKTALEATLENPYWPFDFPHGAPVYIPHAGGYRYGSEFGKHHITKPDVPHKLTERAKNNRDPLWCIEDEYHRMIECITCRGTKRLRGMSSSGNEVYYCASRKCLEQMASEEIQFAIQYLAQPAHVEMPFPPQPTTPQRPVVPFFPIRKQDAS